MQRHSQLDESFADRLLLWFDRYGRKELPWQKDITPYRIWVSEIMLQQTQVNTVIPYYNRFLEAFPTIEILAAANEDAVLHKWTGLGYYARARNLLKASQKVMMKYEGKLPLSVDKLCELPGIGQSTAGAIVAICTNKYAVILDGNVKRVLTRYLSIGGWPGKNSVMDMLWREASALTPRHRVADYTQAIMDLGATVCRRTKPDCKACPLNSDCQALLADTIDLYPEKKPKKILPLKHAYLLVITNDKRQVMLEKRPSSGLWGGLWSFPETRADNIEASLKTLSLIPLSKKTLDSFRHTFSHFHLEIIPVHIKTKHSNKRIELAKHQWFNLDDTPAIGLTRPVTLILKKLRASLI